MTAYDLSILAIAAFPIACLAIAVVCAFSMRKASQIVASSTRLFGMILIQVIMAWSAWTQYRAGSRTAIAMAIAAEVVMILLAAKMLIDFRKRYPAATFDLGLWFLIWVAALAGLLYAAWAAVIYAKTSAGFQLTVAVAGTLSIVCSAAVALRVCSRCQSPRPA